MEVPIELRGWRVKNYTRRSWGNGRMELTPTGVVLGALGILALWRSSSSVMLAFAFFSGFGATAILNLPELDLAGLGEGKAITPWLFFGGLALLRAVAGLARPGKVTALFRSGTFLGAWIMALALLAALSLGAGMITAARTYVDVDPNYVLRLLVREGGIDGRQLTQAAYWLLGLAVVAGSPLLLETREQIRGFIHAFVLGAVFSGIWGLTQWLAWALGWEWPWWLFNNSVNPWAQGWRQESGIWGLPRMTGVAPEPSLFATALSLGAAAQLGVLGSGVTVREIALAGLLLLLAFLSTATTGALGAILVVVTATAPRTVVWLRRPKADPGRLAVLIGLIVGLTAVAGTNLGQSVLQYSVFEKAEGASFADRMLSMRTAWEGAGESPLLGWGPGSFVARSLPVYLLASTGVLGVTGFAGFAAGAFADLKAAWKRGFKTEAEKAAATLFVLLVLATLSGPQFAQGFFWVPWAAAAALGSTQERPTAR